MKRIVVACWAACLVCGVAAPATPADLPPVKDEGTGTTVQLKPDGRTLAASGKGGQGVWEVDVIKAAGAPAVGQPVVRHLSLKDGTVRAVYGKHSFADFDLKTGKLVASGSD